MKKFVFFLALVLMGTIATGCSSCQSGNAKQVTVKADYDGVVQDFTAGVSHIMALHRQKMYDLCGGQQYEWRNLKVVFNDTIKAETIDELHVIDVTDVFYYWNDRGPWVQYITTNVEKGTLIPDPINDVWIEDDDLSEVEIKLSAEDVLARLNEWNGEIPPSKVMILRVPIGPRNCNAQWVIGGVRDVIFIDAVTGDVTNWCPAFPIPNVNGPLGEWP